MRTQTTQVGAESVRMHIERGWARVCEGERVSTQRWEHCQVVKDRGSIHRSMFRDKHLAQNGRSGIQVRHVRREKTNRGRFSS